MPFPKFTGNCPKVVNNRDAKYTVKSQKGKPVVGIIYETADRERWHATTEQHLKLVNMVNAVRAEHGLGPFGSFCINEYKQVIVPVPSPYYFAGKYERPLRFDFEGKRLSGEPMDLEGNPLEPGDEWVGPHPGIPYVLSDDGTDVQYTEYPQSKVTRNIKLSDIVGRDAAQRAAAKLSAFRRYSGGRFYVNEFGAIFTSINKFGEDRYIYVGQLDMEDWFSGTANRVRITSIPGPAELLPWKFPEYLFCAAPDQSIQSRVGSRLHHAYPASPRPFRT